MKTKNLILLLICCLVISLTGCNEQYSRYTYEFIGAFDTTIQFLGYAKSQKDFEAMAEYGQQRFMELHKFFDIYNTYEGLNNLKTINDNAGIKPVHVEQEIIDLILLTKKWYSQTNGKCNIALGPMLNIWHEYRNEGKINPEKATLPPITELQNAMQFTDINKVITNEENNTVYLEDKNMRLDVGAVAKGYATELIATELVEQGYDNFVISSGGNVKAVGRPLIQGRNKWGIGIQNPSGNVHDPDEPSLDILYVSNMSVVTSGDYQRTYLVNGKEYHHLIDPITLMPAEFYSAVVVVEENSGFADFMSTTLFLTPFDEGKILAEKMGVDAVWIFEDGTIEATPGAKEIMKNLGGASGN